MSPQLLRKAYLHVQEVVARGLQAVLMVCIR